MSYYQVAESCQFPVSDWNSKWDLSSSTAWNPNKGYNPCSPISSSRHNQGSECTLKLKLEPVEVESSHNYLQYEEQRTFEDSYIDISTDFTTTNYGKVNSCSFYSGNRFIPNEYTEFPPINQNGNPHYSTNSFVKEEYDDDVCILNIPKHRDASRNYWNNLVIDEYDYFPNEINQYECNQNSIRNFIKKEPDDDFCGSSSQFKVSDCPQLSVPSSNGLWLRTSSIIKEDYTDDITILETHNPNNEYKINFYNSSIEDGRAGRRTVNVVSEISNDSVELLFERAGLQDLMRKSPDNLLQIKEFDDLFIDEQPLKQDIKQEIDDSGHEINIVAFNRKHYTCSYCDFNTNGRQRLTEHIDRLHLNSGYNMRSTRRRQLRNSVAKENLKFEAKEPPTKSKDKHFKCSVCAYTTNHSESHKKHIEKKHLTKSNNRHNSWDQDSKFQPPPSNNRNINQNQTSAKKSGSEPHKCPQCDFKAHRNDQVMKHIKKFHSKNICYKCSQCDFVSTYNEDYYQHMLSHYGDPPFRCETCSYKSRHIRAFIAHRVTHTGDRLFNCTQCSFSCKRKYHLKGHMISHEKKKKFTCDFCTKKYSYKCSLVRHQKTSCKRKPT